MSVSLSVTILSTAHRSEKTVMAKTAMQWPAAYECRGAIGMAASFGATQVKKARAAPSLKASPSKDRRGFRRPMGGDKEEKEEKEGLLELVLLLPVLSVGPTPVTP